MNQTNFTDILQQPQEVNKRQTSDLKSIIDTFPYFQSARAMYLRGLKNAESFKYNQALKTTAAYTTDRSILFDFITSKTFKQNEISEFIRQNTSHLKDVDVTLEDISIESTVVLDKALQQHFEETKDIFDPSLFQPKIEHSQVANFKTTATQPVPDTTEDLNTEVKTLEFVTVKKEETTVAVPDNSAPENLVIDSSAQDNSGLENLVKVDLVPDISAPDNLAPDNLAPVNLVPENSTLKNPVKVNLTADKSVIDNLVTKHLVPVELAPATPVTDSSARDILNLGKPFHFEQTETHSFNEWLNLTSLKPIEREEVKKDKVPIKIDQEQENKILARDKKFALIEQFISNNPKLGATKKSASNHNIAKAQMIKPEALMTETLARIYVEQKNFKKAIQSYKILSLKYPEKSGFFADQIKAVKQLQEQNNTK